MKSSLQKGIAAAFIFFVPGVFAATLGLQPLPYNGVYIGAAVGASDLLDSEKTTNSVTDIHHFSAIGFIGGGLIGYDLTLHNKFKLGLEGFINGTTASASATQNYSPESSYNISMNYNTGLRILPGYEFSPGTVGYLLLGYSYGNFSIKDTGDYGFINQSFGENGFQFGLGIKTPIYKNFSIRGDLIYTAYASQTSYGLTNPPTETQTYYNTPATFEGMLSLVYKFS